MACLRIVVLCLPQSATTRIWLIPPSLALSSYIEGLHPFFFAKPIVHREGVREKGGGIPGGVAVGHRGRDDGILYAEVVCIS
jgi:hypothetical protein